MAVARRGMPRSHHYYFFDILYKDAQKKLPLTSDELFTGAWVMTGFAASATLLISKVLVSKSMSMATP